MMIEWGTSASNSAIACYKELKATNETLKSLQTQLELAYASTASSGAPVAGGVGITGPYGGLLIGTGLGSTCNTATHLGGSVAVPGGVPGSTTLTAILETKDARIQTLEKEVSLLEAELQRIRECGGRLREQLLKATAVPSSGGGGTTGLHQQHHHHSGIIGPTTATTPGAAGIECSGGSTRPAAGSISSIGSLQSSVLTRGPSVTTALVPYGQTSTLTNPLLAASTGATSAPTGSSCLAGISSGMTTGVVNPYTDRYGEHQQQQQQQQHHHHHHHHHQHQYQQQQLHHLQQQQQQQQHAQQQQQQAIQQHLKQIEPAAAGALALHAHTFNKHDLNFKRQVSFFINNVRIEKNDVI